MRSCIIIAVIGLPNQVDPWNVMMVAEFMEVLHDKGLPNQVEPWNVCLPNRQPQCIIF